MTNLSTQRITAKKPNQKNNIAAIQAGAAVANRAVRSPLVTQAKSSAVSSMTDPLTGEVTEVKQPGAYDPFKVSAERSHLQDIVAKLLPNHRTAKCERVLNGRKGAGVEVFQRAPGEQGFFAGLQTCASVWCCPVCAAKISERRRTELKNAMGLHEAAGGVEDLLTLTIQHDRHDKLADLLAKQKKALAKFNADWTVRNVFAEMGVIGSVRALEVTSGRRSEQNHGWHPHCHTLLFGGIGDGLMPHTAEQRLIWQNRLYDRWAASCVFAGLKPPSREHGVKLDGGAQAGNYVAKLGLEVSKHWDLTHELTKGHSKKSKDGESPFDLLRAIAVDDGDRQAKALFCEYAEAFHGKRQLFWSPGLKKRYAVPDLTDEELEAKKEEKAVLIGTILLPAWKDVLACNGRGTVKRLAIYGWDAVASYLTTIQGRSGRPTEAARRPPDTPQPTS